MIHEHDVERPVASLHGFHRVAALERAASREPGLRHGLPAPVEFVGVELREDPPVGAAAREPRRRVADPGTELERRPGVGEPREESEDGARLGTRRRREPYSEIGDDRLGRTEGGAGGRYAER